MAAARKEDKELHGGARGPEKDEERRRTFKKDRGAASPHSNLLSMHLPAGNCARVRRWAQRRVWVAADGRILMKTNEKSRDALP